MTIQVSEKLDYDQDLTIALEKLKETDEKLAKVMDRI